METFELIAERREDVGRGASRHLRRMGKLPGIVYGANKEATMITMNHNEVLHHLDYEAFYSHILTLKIGDKIERVVLKDLQRHPYKQLLLHIDLLRIKEDEVINMRIPLHFINEDKCKGVKIDGGIISHLISELDIVCLPKYLPEYIEVDMLETRVGDTIHLTDLKMPKGVQLYNLLHGSDDDQAIASVHQPKGSLSDETETVEAEVGAEVENTEDN